MNTNYKLLVIKREQRQIIISNNYRLLKITHLCIIAIVFMEVSFFLNCHDNCYSSNTNCLTDGGEDFRSSREIDIFLRLYPGQIYNIQEQCRMAYGSAAVYHGVRRNSNFIFMMHLKFYYAALVYCLYVI